MEKHWDEIEFDGYCIWLDASPNSRPQKLRSLDAGFDRIMSKIDEIENKIELLKQALIEENGN